MVDDLRNGREYMDEWACFNTDFRPFSPGEAAEDGANIGDGPTVLD